MQPATSETIVCSYCTNINVIILWLHQVQIIYKNKNISSSFFT
jgi:hypothetical protein